MKKDILKRVIAEFHEFELPKIIERKIVDIDLDTKKIVTLAGPRRSGKTYYFYHLIKKLMQRIGRESIIYMNFEDERILPFESREFELILEAYFELYPHKKGEDIYLFLDEIQNIAGWEVAVRRIYDKEKTKIFITGSSSKLSTKEIATALRGRTISYELLPFSFEEILNANGLEVTRDLAYSSKRFSVKKLLEDYMKHGGFPEITLEKNENTKIRILQEYLNTIFFRDLVERFSIKNKNLMKELIKYLVSNISKYYTISSFHRLTGRNLKATKRTLINYTGYLEDVKLFFFVRRFSYSLKEQMINPRKIYAVDIGFRTASGFYFSEDRGRIAENIVFLKLRQMQMKNPLLEVYYWKSEKQEEVDFVLKAGQRISQLIQVCWDPEDIETKQREVNNLIKALEYFRTGEGLIITGEFEGEETLSSKKIVYKPMWKWLLEVT